jgi:hypothetical protein
VAYIPPPVAYQGTNALDIATQQQKLQDVTTLDPLQRQAQALNIQRTSDLQGADYSDQMLAQVARDAQAADPDQAPLVWDRGMSSLAQKGVNAASQYVGHYRNDLADRVSQVYGTKEGAQPAQSAYDPMMLTRAVQGMDPAQRQTALAKQNMIISAFNGVTDEASWNDALGKMRQEGIPVDQIIPQGAHWQYNYLMAKRLLQSRIMPMRDALADAVESEASGAPLVQAPLPKGMVPKVLAQPSANGTLMEQNPITGEIFDTGTKIGARPSAGAALFDYKKQAALDAGMTPIQAMEFANGKRDMSEAQMRLAAVNSALLEQHNGEMPDGANPQQWLQQRQDYYYHQLAGAGSTSPAKATGAPSPSPAAGQGGASGGLPDRAVQAVKSANGKVVTFHSGQKWRWDNGKAVRVQ